MEILLCCRCWLIREGVKPQPYKPHKENRFLPPCSKCGKPASIKETT